MKNKGEVVPVEGITDKNDKAYQFLYAAKKVLRLIHLPAPEGRAEEERGTEKESMKRDVASPNKGLGGRT